MIIDTYGGKADIMGKAREFLFDGPNCALQIKGITYKEALDIIERLEGAKGTANAPKLGEMSGHGTLNVTHAARKAAAEAAHVERAARDTQEADTSEAEDAPPKPALTVDKDKIAALAKGNPAKAPKADKKGKKEPEPAAEEEVEAAPATPPKTSKGTNGVNGHAKAASVPAEDEDEAASVDVPEALLGAKKLRDVLSFLMDEEDGEGLKDADDLKQRCTELQSAVPCLARISDLDARIDRTLEVMDLSNDLS